MHPFACLGSKILLLLCFYLYMYSNLTLSFPFLGSNKLNSVSFLSSQVTLFGKIISNTLFRYTMQSDISRARVWFFEGMRKIMLYTERAHFYHRYKVILAANAFALNYCFLFFGWFPMYYRTSCFRFKVRVFC